MIMHVLHTLGVLAIGNKNTVHGFLKELHPIFDYAIANNY
jgi:hypothetical protein